MIKDKFYSLSCASAGDCDAGSVHVAADPVITTPRKKTHIRQPAAIVRYTCRKSVTKPTDERCRDVAERNP